MRVSKPKRQQKLQPHNQLLKIPKQYQPKLQRKNEDVPMWKLILLGDGDYQQDPVVSVLTQVCKETVPNERAAVAIYEECMKTGRSLVGLHPKEIAEMYVEQLARADPEMIVYSEIEEDKSGND